jgi:D-alanyl-D-alanine carboxypeptidase
MVKAIAVVVILLACSLGHAEGLDADSKARIDRAVLAILDRTQAPSASIAVIKDGKLAYVHAYGSARLEPRVMATPTTRYQIASLSKEIVAAAALLLQQDGKLSLDDKVAKWLPDLKGSDVITLRQCLTHIAGYQDYWPQDFLPPWMLHPTTTDAILVDWAKKPLSFKPGDSWQYSNTGYVVAGRIIEMTAGETLLEFVNDRIFHRLGITDAVDVNRMPLQAPDALGYSRAALGPPELQSPAATGWMFGAWWLALTAADVGLWDLSILHRSLLSSKSYVEELNTAKTNDGKDTGYALGLNVGTRNGVRVFHHDGEGAGYLAQNRIYPDNNAAVVVLTNTFSGTAPADIADAIDLVILPAKGIDARVRAVFDGLQHNHPDRAAFTADFNAYLDEPTAANYSRTLGPLGPPTLFVQTESGDRGGMKFYNYRIIAGAQVLALSTYVTAEDKFEQFLIAPATR